MHAVNLKNKSIWLEHSRPRFPCIKEKGRFDVVIVGGGIFGLTAAYLLKNSGKSVAVLEKGRIGGGETGHTTAHLTMVTDLRLRSVLDNFGEDGAGLAWQAGAAAIDVIEQIVANENIACGFQRVPGRLHAAIAKKTDEASELQDEARRARELGFEATFEEACPIFERPAIRFADQAIFQPIDYVAALARAVHGEGSAVYEQSEAAEFNDDPSVLARGCRLQCDKIVIATHVPLVGLTGFTSESLFQTKLAGYNTYAIGAKSPNSLLAAGSYWDTENPYYYTRVESRRGGSYIVFGGEDRKTGQEEGDAEQHYARLEELLKTYIPDAEIDHRWGGQVIEPADGLPYIGPITPLQFIGTGFSGNGLTFGTFSGMMARDWVLGKENPWQDLFSPDRKAIRAGMWHYLRENLSYPYHLVKGFLTTPEKNETPDTLLPGEGKVLELDGQRCAVSRDAEGALHTCSAICTHMGCVVRWNSAEKSWDCPCHGSRFLPDGSVMAGPAEKPLAAIYPAEAAAPA